MPWVRVDDGFHMHPKVLAAWEADPASIGLWMLALSYSGHYLTDGQINKPVVRHFLPHSRSRSRAIGALTSAGLWDETDGGWLIHDYLDFNPPRLQVQAERVAKHEAKVRAGKAGANSRWHGKRITER